MESWILPGVELLFGRDLALEVNGLVFGPTGLHVIYPANRSGIPRWIAK
jgi:hypothetical protein